MSLRRKAGWATRWTFVTISMMCGAAQAQSVRLEAPDELAPLLERHLRLDELDLSNTASRQTAAGTLRQRIPELLSTQGYFSPGVETRFADEDLLVKVQAGPQTHVREVDIVFSGAIDAEAASELRQRWPLPVGTPFTQANWDRAKQWLLIQLLSETYPEAGLVASNADIDPEQASARLSLRYDSGPRVTLGPLRYEGLSRYSPATLERFNQNLQPGQPYREADLLKFQNALQQTPYFSSVSVELDTSVEPDPGAEAIVSPLLVRVRERQPHRIDLGVGYSSNTGARVEANYRTADFLNRAWDLQTGVRLEQLRQTAYADLFFPPNADRSIDSIGIAGEHADIQNLVTDKGAFGAQRVIVNGPTETRLSLNWITERQQTPTDPPQTNRALTPNAMWTWRNVNNPLDPRSGWVVMGEAGGGTKAVLSDQNFLRVHGRLQWFIPVAARDVLSLRGELGATLAPSRDGIPNDWLFRTGGAQTIRGYKYLSLGVQRDTAVVGGRYLGVASAEYTHWIDNQWGVASFVDSGDACDDRKTCRASTGAGFGVRWKSPAGPIGLDLAHGFRTGENMMHFSLAIPF